MKEWLSIETAPKDGRPIWARGYNFGEKAYGTHHTWAYWGGEGWVSPLGESGENSLLYLTEWLPQGE